MIPTRHKEFITLVANGTNQDEAYMVTVGKNKVTKATARTKGSQLAKKYAKEIEFELLRLQKAVEAANDSSVVKEAFKGVLSKAERMQILTAQATGEMEIEESRPVWNPVEKQFQIVKVKSKAGFNERKNAIAELNKMDGSYEPNKSEVKVNTFGILNIDPIE